MACLFLSGLAACSTLRFGYSQAARFSYWWLDGYADFTDAQSPAVHRHIASFFAWHRKTQLPDYASLLARARQDALHNATPSQACQWADDVTQRVDASLRQMVPALVDVGSTLSGAQLRHMAQKFEKVNEGFVDDFLQSDRARRLKASGKRAVERAESVYGSLSRTQRELITDAVAVSPFSPEAWLAERKQRQQDILQLLGALPQMSHEAALSAMTELVDTYQHSPRAAYAAHQGKLLQYNCALAAQLHNSATADQRQKVADRLKGWEDDLLSLSLVARGSDRLPSSLMVGLATLAVD